MFLKEGLQLDGANLKVLKQTMKMGVIASTSFPSYFLLSQLEWLCLEEVNNLESLPKKWLQNLISLQKLYIWQCPNLASISHEFAISPL